MEPSTWPIKNVAVTRLKLDPENPRFATAAKRPTQPELIADLIEHEDVASLARDIARLGFFPNELLVVVNDGGAIVVEGNRRLAALKLLLNPQLAPANSQKKFQQYADLSRHKITRIPVVIAPSRTAAVPLIIARHKGESVKAWTPVMQSRFVQSRFDHGLSVDEIAGETGLEKTEILRQLRDAKLYDVIRSLPLAEDVEAIVHDPRSFPFTTLRRLIDYSSVQTALGMVTDEKKGFTTSLPAERFQQVLSKIVADIATEKVTSRTHNTAVEVAAYLAEIESSFGKARKSKKQTPADEFVDPSRVQPPAPKKRPKKKKKARPPIGLIPSGFEVRIKDARIEAVVEELKKMKIDAFPNAAAITFRSLLDMSVTKFLNDAGEIQVIRTNLSKKQARPADWLPSLKQQLDHILATPTINLGPEGRKALQKFVSDASQPLTLDTLNWFTHVRYVPPTVEQLRAFWTMLTPLVELTLQ